MYNVLIVDDEKMMRDDVYSLLSMEEDLELDLTTASSAVEAKDIFESRKVDIAILDINMPQMTGLELFDIILERWPHCKVIFLTGYSDFDYVYKVHQHAKYVLKAEDDDKLLNAVRESITELDNSMLLEQLTDLQREQNRSPVVHEKSLFLRDLFKEGRNLSQLTPDLSARLDINIDLKKPVYYVLLRHEAWYYDSYQEQQATTMDLYELIRRYFLDLMHGAFFEYSKNYIVIFAQPNKLQNPQAIVHVLEGSADLFQKALMKNIGKNVSILIGSDPVSMEVLQMDCAFLLDQMVWLSDGEMITSAQNHSDVSENAQIFSETDAETAVSAAGTVLSEESVMPESLRQYISQLVMQLEFSIEGMEEEKTFSLLQQLRDSLTPLKSMHDLTALEAYCNISVQLLSLIKRLNIYQDLAFKVSIRDLYNVSSHHTWKEAFEYLYRVTENIFCLKNQGVEKKTEDVIDQVKAYILNHLDGDTSLYALSEQVHFSQEYLLRIFKKKEGVTILQFINDRKLASAKTLLTDTDLPIREIAERLGFASQGYFGRFFRSKTGLTPNAYRERKE